MKQDCRTGGPVFFYIISTSSILSIDIQMINEFLAAIRLLGSSLQ